MTFLQPFDTLDTPSAVDVLIVGEYASSNDKKSGRYLSGSTGKHLIDTLQRTGFDLSRIYYHPLLGTSPQRGDMDSLFLTKTAARKRGIPLIDGAYPEPCLQEARAAARRLLARLRPTLVISLGNAPMWAVGGIAGSAVTWNGSMLSSQGANFMPIISPITVSRMWTLNTYFEHAFRKAQQWTTKLWQEPEWNFRIYRDYRSTISTLETLVGLLEDSVDPLLISCDLETRHGHIACAGLAWSNVDALCVPFMIAEEPYSQWTPDQEFEIIKLFRTILTHKNALICGQNYEYDRQYIAREWGFRSRCDHDTMTLHHTWNPDLKRGLDTLTFLYRPFYRYWKDESKDWDPRLGEVQLWRYNCLDAVNTWDICNRLLKTRIASDPFYLHQAAMHEPVLDMTLRGTRCDVELKAQMTAEVKALMKEREDYFKYLVGERVVANKKASYWWDSPQQTMKLFYDIMGIQPVYKRSGKKMTRTSDDAALEKIGKREPLVRKLCQLLQEYRSLSVFHDTFLTMDLDWDNRIRCQYHIDGPRTFRFASTGDAFHFGTNLQNIPKGNE